MMEMYSASKKVCCTDKNDTMETVECMYQSNDAFITNLGIHFVLI
jgi:hypothetical protein